MAIGSFGNGRQNNTNGSDKNGKLFEQTYYSRFRIKNQDGKMQLSASFSGGLLILSIDEIGENYSVTSIQKIHLSPTKAYLLSLEHKKFMEYANSDNVVEGKAFGINAGMSEKVTFIGFHATRNNTKLVTIGKIDSNGNILEKATLEFNKDYHYALEWDNIDTMDVSRANYNDIELDQLGDLLEDFARHMNGAIAYSTMDLGRYEFKKVLNKMDPIYDKLGIERKFDNGYSSKSNNFLNNLGNTNRSNASSQHVSLDDISDDLMEE